jgi:hypothetical protein
MSREEKAKEASPDIERKKAGKKGLQRRSTDNIS